VSGGSTAPVPEIDEPTPTRRGRLAGVALAVVAVLALVVGALVVADRGGTDRSSLASFSLVAAAEQAIAADTVEFSVTVSADGIGEVTTSGAVDNDTEVMVLSVGLDSIMPLGGLGGGEVVEMIVDAEAGMLYFGADALGGLVPGGASWISADLGAIAEASGQSLDDLGGELFLDPTESARLLLDAEQVTEIGPETVDGDATVRYQVTVDLAAAIAAIPQAGAELDAQGVDVPDTVVYDVWVTEDNQLRRAAFEIEVAGQSVATTLEMRASNEPLDVEIPTDTFDLTDFIDGF
jgi:hypothetical protein